MQLEGTSRRLPIYLLLDVSGSMGGAPIEAVNMGLRDFEAALKNDPHALETAWISVLTFASDARQLLPLTEAGLFRAPALSTGGGTALGAAIRLLGQSLDQDLREKDASHPGDWKPLIFLFTDGEPTDEWRADFAAFRQRRRALNLIAIGCGPMVNQQVLKELTESVLLSQDLSPERIKALFKWISQSARVASRAASLQAVGGGAGGPTTPPPPAGFQIAL